MTEQSSGQGFHALGLPPRIHSQLKRLGFVTPTPIQREAIPVALRGQDLIGVAQTGTGKTLAFGLPIAARLQKLEQALVLAPTRELAQQIHEALSQLGLRTALLIGGAPMKPQIGQIKANPAVIVATPGRLEDHLAQRTVTLGHVRIVVLDEADRMLDMGFAPSIRRILDRAPKHRQTMLFSATMPKEIVEMAQRYQTQPIRVEIERPGTASELVEQELVVLQKEQKNELLGRLLDEHEGTTLVFARTRHGARKLARIVRGFGHSAAELHSDRTLSQRRDALQGFKDGNYRVLVATDIAARGIDVKEIALVVNYDLPTNPEDYVHRIGRTGRAGSFGRAVTLATPDQHRDVRDIEKLLRKPLRLSKRSPLSLASAPTRIGEGARRPQRDLVSRTPEPRPASRRLFQS